VAALQPKNMPRHTVPLEVKFEQCLLNSEAVLPVNGGIAGGPGDSRLEIRFNAPSMVSGSKSRYRFRLRGLEESWNEAKEVGLALFRRVPPGEYIFEVDAANCDGVWTAAPARLAVKISPPFWKTIWFIGAMLAVGGVITLGIGWLAGRIRLRSRMEEMRLQNARESERTRIAQDLHDDLGARLTEITLLASLGADDSQSPETAKEIVKSLETKTRAVVGTLDEIVWAVNPRHDTLTSFRDYAAACAVDLTEAASKRLRLDISDSLPDSALTSEQRHHLFLAYREALNNAVKHSDAEQIHVSMHAGGGLLTLSVADDGKGFSSAEITLGEGLKNLHQRLKDMGGDCKVVSKPGGGTTVIFTMPLPETTPTKS
jgi:signal transduction histidine kinase